MNLRRWGSSEKPIEIRDLTGSSYCSVNNSFAVRGEFMWDPKYSAPGGIKEALRILAEWGAKGILLAGGTDLLPQINYYELKPEVMIFLGGLNLDYIKESNGGLAIGATTTTALLAGESPVSLANSIMISRTVG